MDLHLDLANADGSSLRARLEHALRDGIRSGLLAPGMRLPATRVLCGQLGVSRGVVVDAYAQLTAEGYLRARRGAGTTVAATAELRVPANASQAGLDRDRRGDARDPTQTAPAPTVPAIRYDLSPFVPALGAFPRAAWRGAVTRTLRTMPDERLDFVDGAGLPELRGALASYLARSRGVRAHADQVVVTNSMRQGLGLVWSTMATGGARRIGIERPGWRGMAETASDAGLAVVPLPVDGEGLVVVPALSASKQERLDAVAVAPAHQYPTGAVLSPARRAELVAWAQARDALIVEDDYDAEYRYDREPIGSLQGLAPEHVVYGGSASKSLAPGVRVAWFVLPAQLVEPVAALQRRRGGMPASLQQLALADLIERGELDRHLRRQRRLYRRRRDALLAALAAKLPQVTVHGAAAGLFVVLRLPANTDARVVVANARAAGLALVTLDEEDGADDDAPPALVVGYGNLAEAAIAPAVDVLAMSLRTT